MKTKVKKKRKMLKPMKDAMKKEKTKKTKVGQSAIKGAKEALEFAAYSDTGINPRTGKKWRKTDEDYPYLDVSHKGQKKSVEDLFAGQLENDPIVIEVIKWDQIYKHTVKWQREFQGIEGRKFRFDFADEFNLVAVEIQGGVFIRGGHSTGLGITKDCEKLALALINGWKLFQFTTAQARSGQAIEWLREYYKRNV